MKNKTIYTTIKVRMTVNESRANVRDAEGCVKLLRVILDDLDVDQEHFIMLSLNKGNDVTGFKVVHTGGQDETIVDMKSVYRNALLMGATSIIVCHNHPSGRTEPSAEDTRLTLKLKEAGALIDIKLLDHIIIGGENTFLFSEHGLI